MNSFSALLPLLILVAGSLLVLLFEVFLKKENRDYLAYISIVFLIGCAAACIWLWNRSLSYFDGYLQLDNIALLFSIFLVIATLLIILISIKYIVLQDVNYGEYYALLLLALSGMLIMVSSQNLLVIFLGLEVLSMSSYALAGLKRSDLRSVEAAVKYFLLGSFASAFLVFGIALLYGASFSTDINLIIGFFQSESSMNLVALFGLGLIIVGFGFKIAIVPFHMWTPDVYQGAPTPITAFFSVGPKIVGFAVLLRIFYPYWKFVLDSQVIFTLLWILSVLTMVVGNLIALRQTNIKRILAYSSIAHAGYLLIAILAQDNSGLIFYLTVYLFMNVGAFAAVIALGKKDEEYLELDDYAGIGFKYPWIGATLTVFLLSLAGFPPTGGFLAKFYVFSAAVRQGLESLVIIAVFASLVSVFYYLRIVIYMYMRDATREVDIHLENPALFFVLFLCLYGVLQLGIFPGNILVIINQAIQSLPIF
jgi:NADH-quinone oxidoreductase subunit N